MSNLFVNGVFRSHSGQSLAWKIECDALSDEDIETLAMVIANKFSFSRVVGVPRGGVRLANALQKYCEVDTDRYYCSVLIVDDVLTTGASMEEAKRALIAEEHIRNQGGSIWGVVVFARGECPWWVTPLFTCNVK